MKRNVTLLDGAVGSSLWEKADKYQIKKDPVWKYNIEHPEIVTELAKDYINAGAQIVLANTFAANSTNVKHSSSYSVSDVVKTGVRLEKDAVKGTNTKVALAIGPLTEILEPLGKLTRKDATVIFEEQIGCGMEEKPDCIMLQTFMDIEMMKIATSIAKRYDVPVFCTMSFGKSGKTMWGNSVQNIIDSLRPFNINGIGMNCSLGPELALPIIKKFSELTDIPLVFKPNAGMPIVNIDGTSTSSFNAEIFAKDVAPSLEFVSYIGGCCGCNADYIRELRKLI